MTKTQQNMTKGDRNRSHFPSPPFDTSANGCPNSFHSNNLGSLQSFASPQRVFGKLFNKRRNKIREDILPYSFTISPNESDNKWKKENTASKYQNYKERNPKTRIMK